MKRLIAFLFAILLSATFADAQDTDNKIIESMYLKPKTDKLKTLMESLSAHNKKFHASGPYKANVWMANTGSHSGDLAWVMGPCTFTDLDNRPDSDEHQEDWMNNVMPNIESVSDGEYWKLNSEASYRPEGSSYGKELWSVYDIKPFDNYRFIEIVKKVVKVYEEKKYPNHFELWENRFMNIAGRDMAISWGFENYAFFDRDMKFSKDYEEIHGEGTWDLLMEEFKDVVIAVDQELAERIDELSADE
jgi:hypothetical protein